MVVLLVVLAGVVGYLLASVDSGVPTAVAPPQLEQAAGTPRATTDTATSAPAETRTGDRGRSAVVGDLGLSTPMSRPGCDGRGIVVLYSAVTPGAYAQEISSALAQNPGASYLRTDMACPSLRPRDENGNVIYAVYRASGYSLQQLCADVRAEGPPAYGRWLDTSSDPAELVMC